MLNKRLINTGEAAPAPFDPLQNFENVTYTGNGGTQKITGYIRKGGAFNGSSSKVDLPSTIVNSIKANNSFTISAWFNTSTTGTRQMIFSSFDGTYIMLEVTTGNQLEGNVANSVGTNIILTVPITVTDGNWHHALFTGENGDLRLYLDNGSPQTSTSWNGTHFNGTTGTDIGSRFGNDYFNGKIDQVRIFDRALDETTDGEVTTLYDETYASSTKSTTDIFGDGSGVALYELDEDAGDTGKTGTAIDSGQSASFTGVSNNRIEFPSGIDTIFNTKNFGLSLWVKAPNAVTDSIFTTETTNSTFGISANWNIANAYSFQNGGGGATNLGAVDSNWHHIVVTSDGSSSYKGYFDGVYKGAVAYRVSGSTSNTVLGGFPSGGFQLVGQVDQVRIFNRQLSQSDIDDLYDETAPSTVDYFSDGNGKALYKLDNTPDDESGSYDATWNGTAAYINAPAYTGQTLYNGTPTNVNFLGMAFQPDFVWVKRRDASGNSHILQDSIRGGGQSKTLISDSTVAEGINGQYGFISSFDSNGFTVAAGTTSAEHTNLSSATYVGWCWKAGGAAVSGTSSHYTNCEISANPDAGFSIVNFTIPGGIIPTTASYNHGLNDAPKLIITKPYNGYYGNSGWYSWAEPITTSNYLVLNTPDGAAAAAVFSSVDSSTVKYRFASNNVGTNSDVITYNFTDVDGYQKVGSYSGNGSSSNTITGVGFEPRFLMIKNSTGVYEWVIVDSVRGGSNELNPNSSAAENGTGDPANITFNSDGFIINNAEGATNQNNATIIYLAIA